MIHGRTALRRTIGGALAVASLALAACGGGSTDDPGPVATQAEFDPANFVDPTTSANEWLPLTPGLQSVKEGTTEVGSREVPHQVITTVTNVVREIDGVPAIAVIDQDTDAGQITQVSIDYLAVDRDGNIWMMGGYTEEYDGGQFTNTADAWLGSGSGNPGILMPADPTPSTPRWEIGEPFTDEASAAEVVETGASECVPFGCYDGVLVIREGKVSAIDNEFKFYASEVGLILNTPRKDSRHKDVEALVNLTQLSAGGLSEMNDQVVALEEHARTTEPDIFGPAPGSTIAGGAP